MVEGAAAPKSAPGRRCRAAPSVTARIRAAPPSPLRGPRKIAAAAMTGLTDLRLPGRPELPPPHRPHHAPVQGGAGLGPEPADRRARQGRLVVGVPGRGARRAGAAGGHLQPDRGGVRRQLPPGPPDRGRGARHPVPDRLRERLDPGQQIRRGRRLLHRHRGRHGDQQQRLGRLDHQLQRRPAGELGAGPVGQHPSAGGKRHGHGPGRRRRHRQRPPVRPGRAGRRLFRAPLHRRAGEAAARHHRGVPALRHPDRQPVQGRLRLARQRAFRPDPAAGRPGQPDRPQQRAGRVRARHRHAGRRAARGPDHRADRRAGHRRARRAGRRSLDPAPAPPRHRRGRARGGQRQRADRA